MLDGHTPLRIFDAGFGTALWYKDEVLEPHGRLFGGAIGQDFIFMDYNVRSLRVNPVKDFLEEKNICRWNL
ncbi:hypothetical protein TNCV_2338581 [Trichonephila clavipes]|nr:hypothetical protein TNCV_2338581 [Trichonephila clavipes]